MPQNQSQNKKKKKGRAPAHQNTFAFSHNPRSKKTAAILATPIQHVCRRCHEKLEWRKQYRKYKPRTAPGKCNICQKRNVLAAYHTICESCTRTSGKAVSLLDEWNSSRRRVLELLSEKNHANDEEADDAPAVDQEMGAPDTEREEDSQQNVLTPNEPYHRVCAVCVKEPALHNEEDHGQSGDANGLDGDGRRLKLREIKTLERKLQKSRVRRKQEKVEDDEDENQSDGEAESVSDKSGNQGGGAVLDSDEESSEHDPFLQAVGGADKLLTGEAYQQMLLENAKMSLGT